MPKPVELTMEEFEERFPLQFNPSEEAEPIWEDEEGRGCWFETYGEDLEFVKKQDPAKVWTVMDDESIVSGFHVVNRFGYLISREPRRAGEEIVVLGQE